MRISSGRVPHLVLSVAALASCRTVPTVEEATGPVQKPSILAAKPDQWVSLFDGTSLGAWRMVTEDDFCVHGGVSVADGAIVLGDGSPFTGIQWTGEVVRSDFEVTVEAKRLTGCDIFCGLTVPVGDSCVTLVLGGWGDSVVGLSNVDGFNASENETTKVMSFKDNQWYTVRLRVTSKKIEASIDDELVVEQLREGHTFTIYEQLEPLKPLGFFSWMTTAALRGIRVKRLWPE